MEKSTQQPCALLPHFCNAGMEAPKQVVKPERTISPANAGMTNLAGQKLWSVFGDVYWI